jgi:hypothetical protein
MRYRLILPIAVLLAALVAVPAAQAKVRVGLSEQSAAMFDQPSWAQLKLKRVRYILSWDYYKDPNGHAEVTGFMNAARAKRQEVLVTFSAHRGCFLDGRYKRAKVCRAPSAAAYKASVKRFRKEFPYARLFSPWNEANHLSQPTFHRPALAARYYKALRSVCKRCTVMAADVLDQPDLVSYLRRFLRASKGKGRIWGLHNYADVNRLRSSGVSRVLRTVRGQVWLTETGGIVKFGRAFPYSEKRAAARTKYMFRLVRRYPRVKRIYVYRWFGEPRASRFDAGLVAPDGSPRPALKQFRKGIKGLPR